MRRVVAVTLLVAGLGSAPPVMAERGCGWPAWESFRDRFVEASGRVVDPATPQHITTSEGQSYALFFALVARDRPTFEHLLHWTEANLAGGDLAARLPAWAWGRRDDGGWGVLDQNAAADADLWLAWTLGEAARLWHDERHALLGAALAERIVREETAALPDLGRVLLPGPHGFHWKPDRWRLNPSYLPMQLLRQMAVRHPRSEWPALEQGSREVILRSAVHGFAPDWIAFEGGRLRRAEGRLGLGSYDAIRVYLWAGMLPPGETRERLLATLQPMVRHVAESGTPPLEVESVNGSTTGVGPTGFSAALIPFLEAAGQSQAAARQRQRVAEGKEAAFDHYYDRALMLFATGFDEGHYRFGADGSLVLKGCP